MKLDADYLVVGTGAMGMAFVDTLLTETEATIIMVDKHGKPGGHWNDAYPFVRLHQPSSFYGVNSEKLGNDAIDETGWNKGLHELASGAEVCAYFDHVMQRRFLASGRVQYFPMCEFLGDKSFKSIVTGETQQVTTRKVVDATYMNVSVPSVTPPKYQVANDATCIPLNDLPKLSAPRSQYVVIGAGKTGMDACLWLLSNQVSPEKISWVTPRDSWILDRRNIQPGLEAAMIGIEGLAGQMKAIAESESIDDMFARVEANGQLLRIDNDIKPSMYRCATVTELELQQLKRIKNIIRKGRVQRAARGQLELDDGVEQLNDDALYIDCTADALARMPIAPVFDGEKITLQTVRFCQQVFSAAFIAHVEASYNSEDERNKLCTVVPHPNTASDWMRVTLAHAMNQLTWSEDPLLSEWLEHARLDAFSQPAASMENPSEAMLAAMARIKEYGPAALGKLEQYIKLSDEMESGAVA
ncbi:MAG: NAD(P)/FAD-dependent oxidoreductase [Oceanicoccus sp.]